MPASVARVPASGADGGPRGFPTAGAFAVAAGVAQRMADGSVVFGAPNPAAGGGPSFIGTSAPLTGAPRLPTAASRPVVQRAAEVAEEPPPPEPEPDPVTEPDPVAETEAEPPAGPGGDSVTDAAAAARSAGGPAAPPVTDELVRALYAPLSRLLRNDLRLERERAGRLINTRH
ncbi:hypothetical protein [Streptomyces sp. CFMR 7]|uniref:hypothetical protein n=1 Tax=Streptomyces sp. CFMR 7 TaxID=1649184 RepID=UPI0011A30386|nr:hypothetical protein [Streptomyces sp. CFMR 7]